MAKKFGSVFLSYLIAIPLGLLTILFFLLVPTILTGNLMGMLYIFVYGKAILGLIIAFFIIVGIAGYIASNDLIKKKSLLFVSFKYSLLVNSIIWATFIIITILQNDNFYFAIPAFVAFVFCFVLTTYSFALLICFLIKQVVLYFP